MFYFFVGIPVFIFVLSLFTDEMSGVREWIIDLFSNGFSKPIRGIKYAFHGITYKGISNYSLKEKEYVLSLINNLQAYGQIDVGNKRYNYRKDNQVLYIVEKYGKYKPITSTRLEHDLVYAYRTQDSLKSQNDSLNLKFEQLNQDIIETKKLYDDLGLEIPKKEN